MEESGRKKAGRWNGHSAHGPMYDAEKDWHERSFRASGENNGCQKSPLDKTEMKFSFFIFKLPVTPLWYFWPKTQYYFVFWNITLGGRNLTTTAVQVCC